MIITEKLNKRFCKDNNLSINVYKEPYFTSRLKLYGCYDDYQDFVKMIEEKFSGNEESYFAYYNEVKDKIIDYIKNSATYKYLQTADMSALNYRGTTITSDYPDREVYKENLIGKSFISIDMCKANYTALVAYGMQTELPFVPDEIGFNYYKFIKQFTDNTHIINSKYIRQVVFGNCNPKRQIHFEKCMMLNLLERLIHSKSINKEDIYSVRADEIIIDGFNPGLIHMLITTEFPVSFEYFKLGRIYGTSGYIKNIANNEIKIKCASSDELPFIYRLLKGEEVQPEDLIFTYNGQLAQLLKAPELKIVGGVQ